MKRSLSVLVAAGLLATLPVVAANRAAAPLAPRAQAVELNADRWYNVDGDAPTLEGLRGRAVLIEFWATW